MSREFLERAPGFIPQHRKVQLILDVLDFPENLEATAQSSYSCCGLQLFGGAEVFRVPEQTRIFQHTVEHIA